MNGSAEVQEPLKILKVALINPWVVQLFIFLIQNSLCFY